jgi:hypothetical protein
MAAERQLIGYEVLYVGTSTTAEELANRTRLVHLSLTDAVDAGLTVAVEAAEAVEAAHTRVRVVPTYEDSRSLQRQLARGEGPATLFVLENYSNECLGSVSIHAVWVAPTT